jgi:hypothetical protein
MKIFGSPKVTLTPHNANICFLEFYCQLQSKKKNHSKNEKLLPSDLLQNDTVRPKCAWETEGVEPYAGDKNRCSPFSLQILTTNSNMCVYTEKERGNMNRCRDIYREGMSFLLLNWCKWGRKVIESQSDA